MIMYEMLINLFNGNLNLSEQQPIDFPLRKHYQREYDKLKKQIDGLLDEDGHELLNELLEANTSENGYSNYDSFISGYRIATLLMAEVFNDKDNLLENREQYLRHLMHRPYRGTPSVMDDFLEKKNKSKKKS